VRRQGYKPPLPFYLQPPWGFWGSPQTYWEWQFLGKKQTRQIHKESSQKSPFAKGALGVFLNQDYMAVLAGRRLGETSSK
jgi:hypothetical protein